MLVVLPAPLGPSRQKHCPAGILSQDPATATWPAVAPRVPPASSTGPAEDGSITAAAGVFGASPAAGEAAFKARGSDCDCEGLKHEEKMLDQEVGAG